MLKLRRPKKKYNYNEVYNFIRKSDKQQHHDSKLLAYYEGRNTGIDKKTRSEGKTNIKASHPFASKLVDTFTGYFASKQVKYDTDNKDVLELIDDYLKYNDCEEALITLTRDACIYGQSATMTFLDSKGNVRFCPVDTRELIVICDNSVLEEIHTVIRHWRVENNGGNLVTHYVEVYTDVDVTRYYIESENGNVKETTQPQVTEHYFKDVPFSVFQFNDGKGLFERVIPLIDAYDLAVSNTLDLSNDLVDAILLVTGCELTDEMIDQVRELRLLNASEEIRAEYVQNNLPTNEDIKTRLREDIFSLAGIVDLEDKNWGSASSGVALRLRMASTEFKAGVTQGHFVKSLRRNIELMLNIKSLTNTIDVDSELREINITMQRNSIANETEQIQNALQLSTMLSKETLLGLLQDFIPSVDVELERLANEREESVSFMRDNYDSHDPVEGEEDLEQEGE
ncbi:phage portal protein [Turicibacter sanguinis]|uniref:phage portal protein n=1 Tax=Turicibacter sanguinis TaxID=154288 RepID=UPI0012BBCE3C|nr:phage portal protein [Turicibacter sanguinis]